MLGHLIKGMAMRTTTREGETGEVLIRDKDNEEIERANRQRIYLNRIVIKKINKGTVTQNQHESRCSDYIKNDKIYVF